MSDLGALVPVALLLAALSYATESQGTFYPGPFHVFVILVAGALVASLVRPRTGSWWRAIVRDPVVTLSVTLALVTLVSAGVAGPTGNAAGTVAVLLMMAAVVVVVKGLRPGPRQLLVAGIVVIAVVEAGIGWVALVARWQPDALTSQGLWRAASTLTYENALAAFLTAPALLCLDRVITAPGRRPVWSGAAYLLLVGIGASISRGGLLGLAVGVVVLAALRGWRNLARLGAPAAGALIALACVAPSVPVGSSPHVVLAGAGVAVGAVVATWIFGTPWSPAVRAAVGAAVLGGVVAVVASGHVVSRIVQARASTASSDRAHEWAAAVAVARHHLVLGTGMARVPLQWEAGGKFFTATFAHNEFLQLLIQDGLVGLGVLLVGIAVIFVRLFHVRGDGGAGTDIAWSADCAIAGLAALLVQSSLDFLWHLPVIPVLMAMVVAVATTMTTAAVPDPRWRRPAAVNEAAPTDG